MEKIKKLINQMTVEEKIYQMGSIFITDLIENDTISEEKLKKNLGNGIGQITRAYGCFKDKEPEEVAEYVKKIKEFLKKETRLGIPAIFHEECLSGFLTNKSTQFPQAINMASTWNTSLVKKITAIIRRQMRDAGVHQGLSPVLDVCYDPRWGRTEETFGEDPYLVASMGVSYVKGLQGKDLKEGIIATGKHFAAHGFSEGGRNQASVHTGERELKDVFLFPFEACVKVAGLFSIMNAYHDIDGIPCACSKKLLTEILREKWGFKGIVVSDYSAIEMLKTIHFVAKDEKEAGILALKAGIDIELPLIKCYEKLINAVKNGEIKEELIDRVVERILYAKYELGLFEEENKVLISFDTERDRKVAYKVAVESIVLLKNDGILPLNKKCGKIALIGPAVNNPRLYFGDYGFTAHVDLKEPSVYCPSILEVFKEKYGKKVEYAEGCGIKEFSEDGFKFAKEVAERADLIIFVGGEKSGFTESCTVGESKDSHNLKLPGVQEKLIKELEELKKPFILVLINGRPLNLTEIYDKVDAIVEGWFPGEETGRAIFDIITGKVSPSGRLSVSFPKDAGQIPVYYHRNLHSKNKYIYIDSEPLFPFGFGLSYTKFKYSNLKISPEDISPSDLLNVSVEVENTGNFRSSEVVQLYIKKKFSSVVLPSLQLKGFSKVNLKKGERKRVEFLVPVEILAFHDANMKIKIEKGEYEVLIGRNSRDIEMRGAFTINSDKFLRKRKKFFSRVKVKKL